MEQGTMKKMRFALVGAMVAAVCALCMLPGMAFASTNVTVKYQNGDGIDRSVVVDLDTLSADNTTYGYMFREAGVNNVIKADKTVTLDAVVAQAKQAAGDGEDDSVWISGKSMAFTTIGGSRWPQFSFFTYDNLEAAGYFYGSTLSTGSPLGAGTVVPTVLALKSNSAAMDSSSTTQTASAKLATITTSTSASPRLLRGYPSATPTDIGDNRFPYAVESITIF